ncbi:hypothetical protein, partial [Klebsiella pneumoniae]
MKHKPQMMKMRWLSAAVMLSLCTSSAWAFREGANKQVISSQADSLIKISRIWA